MKTLISKHAKTIVMVMAKILLTLFAFYVISRRITLNPFAYFNKNSMNYFLVGVLLSFLLVLLQALRWKHIVGIFSVKLPYGKSLIAVWAGHLINNILPTATAGDLLRSYTLRYADTEKKWRWLGAFLSEKYSAASSALLIACLTFALGIANQLPSLLTAFILSLLIFLLAAPLIITRVSFTQKMPAIHKINRLAANTFLNPNGRLAFLISFFINFLMCTLFYVIAKGLGSQITFIECLFVVPVFTLLASLPISYAGWGVRELSCVGLLQFFGVSAESAVIISIMYGLTLLFSCTPGIFVVYHFIATRRNMSVAREETPLALESV